MAKARIRNLDKVFRNIEKVIGQNMADVVLPKVADMSLERIRAETIKGNSLVTEGKMKPLQEHSTYIRRAKSKKPVSEGGFKPGPFFKWKKSNLSQTGQLLESLKAKIKKNLITIEPTGTRDQSLGESDITTNKELAKDLSSRGFVFLGLDTRGIKRIKQMIIDEIRRLRLKNGFK